jgi:branched-chain amino acid transport system substrate-binding protein
MLRFLLSITILFLLSSCVTDQVVTRDLIPDDEITSKPVESIKSNEPIEDNKLNIALLAPLGKQKEHIGTSLVQSAQLAIADANNPDVNLILLDSELLNDNPELLLNKLEEEKVKVILGPLYGSETEKLEPLLREKDITILSLSNDSSIQGNSLLMLGVSPDSQADLLTRYAISQGINHFYLLLPSNKYGQLTEKAVAEVVSSKDNTTYTVTWYNQENAEQVTEELVKSINNNKTKDSKAIFMPQAGSNLAKLNQALLKAKLKIRLIGGHTWDNQAILHLPSFDGAILLRKNLVYDNFREEFLKLFSNEPNNIDFITYNGLMVIEKMYRNKISLDKQTIIKNNQYFRKDVGVVFHDNGKSIYNMTILEIHNRNFTKVEYHP